MKTFRLWVVATNSAIKTLKARAASADIPFQEYLGLVLAAAAEAEPIEVPERTDESKSSYAVAA